jgi:hypothetical protein
VSSALSPVTLPAKTVPSRRVSMAAAAAQPQPHAMLLDKDLLAHVLSMLVDSPLDRLRAACVSRVWHRAARSDAAWRGTFRALCGERIDPAIVRTCRFWSSMSSLTVSWRVHTH